MDLTGATGAMENITINSVGGYTNILEAGQHPAWGAMVSHVAVSCSRQGLSHTRCALKVFQETIKPVYAAQYVAAAA